MKKNFIEIALKFIFPQSCGFCGEITDSYICKYCKEYIEKIQINKIKVYDNMFYSTHCWLFEYKDEIREKIIDYKFNGKSYLYRTFAQLIVENKKIYEYIKSFDLIIPVPIHKKRKKYRGYNQSELIAREISNKIKSITYKENIIKKINNVKPQSKTFTKNERIENIKDAYKIICNEDLSDKKVLIFDDVYTTGSTVNECAKLINALNCKEIGVLTIAKD